MELASPKAFPTSCGRSSVPRGISNVLSTFTCTSLLHSSAPHFTLTASLRPRYVALCSDPMESGGSDPTKPLLGKKLYEVCTREEEGNTKWQRIWGVILNIKRATWSIRNSLFYSDQSRPLTVALDEAKVQIEVIKDCYRQYEDILQGNKYRYSYYSGTMKAEGFCCLAFMHWLETGNFLMYDEVGEKLGLSNFELFVDKKHYLDGLYLIIHKLLDKYMNIGMVGGDYDYLVKVLEILTDLKYMMLEGWVESKCRSCIDSRLPPPELPETEEK